MGNALQTAGSQGTKQTHYAPLLIHKFFKGMWTQRSPLTDAGTSFLIEKFYSGTSLDGLIGGLNTEISNRLTLIRRKGMSVYNSQTFPAIQRFYEFRQVVNNAEVIQVIADSVATVYDATGPSTKTTIFTKTAGAGQSFFQGVGGLLFWGDGIEQKKYSPSVGVNNWGISNGAATLGPTVAGAGANGILNPANTAWTNPNNVTSGAAFATVVLTGTGLGGASQGLVASTFGFSVPAGSVVTGIQVTCQASATAPVALAAFLFGGGPSYPYNGRIINPYSGAAGTLTFGGPADNWGADTSASQANSAGFSVVFVASNGSAATVSIKNVQITLYLNGALAVTPTGSGSMAATRGYQYVACYSNSNDNTVSSPTLASLNTGPFTGKAQVNVVLVASGDPQTNQIRVFRTTDGGSIFYELPNSPFPNTSATIVDTAGDPDALTGPILNIFSQAPFPFQNNPPPAGMINCCYHLGRIFGSYGNTMVWSAGADVILGDGNQAFPPVNNFVLPALITRFQPLAIGILIFTTAGVYFSANGGVNQDTPTVPVPFMEGKVAGLMQYNAMDICGSTMYLVNSKKKALQIDIGTGVGEIGFPIGDQMANGPTDTGGPPINPANCYVAWHEQDSTDSALYIATPGSARSGLTGGTWWRMNPAPAPENGVMWSPIALAEKGFSAVQSIETSPGVHQLLFGPPAATGQILARANVYQDNGTSYGKGPYAVIGSTVLVHPGQEAIVDFLSTYCVAVGSFPIVTVMLDEIGGEAQMATSGAVLGVSTPEPGITPALSTTLYNQRWWASSGVLGSGGPLVGVCQHMQTMIAWPVENAANELLMMAIWGAHYQEA